MSEKSPKNIKNTCKTNIYKFRANSKKTQQVNPSPFKSAQVPWTYFLLQAVRDGIINQAKGEYRNPVTGEVMSIDDALDKNLLVVEEGRPDQQDSDEVSLYLKTIFLKSYAADWK